MQKAANSCLSIRRGNMSCLLSSKQGVDAVIKRESLDDEAGGLNMLQLQYSLHGRVSSKATAGSMIASAAQAGTVMGTYCVYVKPQGFVLPIDFAPTYHPDAVAKPRTNGGSGYLGVRLPSTRPQLACRNAKSRTMYRGFESHNSINVPLLARRLFLVDVPRRHGFFQFRHTLVTVRLLP
jgi:hypothetical protein